MSQSAEFLRPTRETVRARSPFSFEAVVALLAVAIVPLRIRTVFEIPLGVVVCAVLLPVTARYLGRYVGAWSIAVLTVVAAASGWALTFAGAAIRDTSDSLLAAQLGRVLGIGLVLAALLWARTLVGPRMVVFAFGIGTFLNVALSGVNETNPWKFSFSIPLTLVLLSLPFVYGRRFPQFIVAVCLAGVSALADSRSAAGFLLVAAAITLTQSRATGAGTDALRRWIVALRLALLGFGAFVLLQAAILEGVLGDGIQERTEAQITQSGSVLTGGRPEIGASWALLSAEPWGYGAGVLASGTDVRIAKTGMASLGYDPNNGYVENYMFGNGIELHSLFADLWMHFGLAGVALAVVIVVFAARGLLHDVASGVGATVVVYLVIRMVWDLAFSPWLSSLTLLPLAIAVTLSTRPPTDRSRPPALRANGLLQQ